MNFRAIFTMSSSLNSSNYILCFFLFSQQSVYGRMGKKPNKPLIEAYEHFTYGHTEDLKSSQILKVHVSRSVVRSPVFVACAQLAGCCVRYNSVNEVKNYNRNCTLLSSIPGHSPLKVFLVFLTHNFLTINLRRSFLVKSSLIIVIDWDNWANLSVILPLFEMFRLSLLWLKWYV